MTINSIISDVNDNEGGVIFLFFIIFASCIPLIITNEIVSRAILFGVIGLFV